jgi:hypothetical protein
MESIVRTPPDHARRRALIVAEQIPQTQRGRLAGALSSILSPGAVLTVPSTADARAALERDARSLAVDHWFVLCGLVAPSWSTIALLEWTRCQPSAGLQTALLTTVARELLPTAIIDHPRVRHMPAAPSLDELVSWITGPVVKTEP